MLSLWRYGEVTGRWCFVRACTEVEASAWLAKFEAAEVGIFKLARSRPARKPNRELSARRSSGRNVPNLWKPL